MSKIGVDNTGYRDLIMIIKTSKQIRSEIENYISLLNRVLSVLYLGRWINILLAFKENSKMEIKL